MTGSICPSHWELPYGGQYSGIGYNDVNGSFLNSLRAYAGDILGPTTGNNKVASLSDVIAGKVTLNTVLTGSPYHFLRSGCIYPDERKLLATGSIGYSWSSVAGSQETAHYLGFSATQTGPNDARNRFRGYPVRCLITAE